MKTYQDRIKMLDTFLYEEELQPVRDFLHHCSFLAAPASRAYHGAYDGGLFDHSYEVAKTLQELTDNNNLTWQKSRSPKLVGICHDLCKIDQYIKDYDSGIYTYNPYCFDWRHGEKSVDIIRQVMPDLTEEEELCIKYHMGFTLPKEEWDNWRDAIKKYPNVLWTHQADMISSFIKGI